MRRRRFSRRRRFGRRRSFARRRRRVGPTRIGIRM